MLNCISGKIISKRHKSEKKGFIPQNLSTYLKNKTKTYQRINIDRLISMN